MKDAKSRAKAASEVNPVTIEKGINGLDKVILRQANGSSAEIYLYGAQVTSWKNEHGEELLFVSSKANFKPNTPIRGGIPIWFPRFTDLGPGEQHGFACTSFWRVEHSLFRIPNNTDSRASVELVLKRRQEYLNDLPMM